MPNKSKYAAEFPAESGYYWMYNILDGTEEIVEFDAYEPGCVWACGEEEGIEFADLTDILFQKVMDAE